AWVFVTSTGTPRAAQTLLKFTPAAITITSASVGPIWGTSITSSRIASSGSAKRSGCTSWACILAGTSPTAGMSPTEYRPLAIALARLLSTHRRVRRSLAAGRWRASLRGHGGGELGDRTHG